MGSKGAEIKKYDDSSLKQFTLGRTGKCNADEQPKLAKYKPITFLQHPSS